MKHFKDGIDFLVVSYYKPEYISLLVSSIRKYVKYSYLITVVANEKIDSAEYIDLVKTYKNDKDVKILEGTGQIPISERKNGVEWNIVVNDGIEYKYGPGSVNHSKGLTIGMKNTDRKYICFLDNDVVFLNSWVDDLMPSLDKAFLISHRMDLNKGPNGIIREMFMFFKRKNFKKYNLHPNCEYVDGAGNITKCVIDNNEDVMILENSLWNFSLKEKHLLNLNAGEQSFIGDKPFFYHYGRGSTRNDKYYKEWITEVTKYLDV